MLSQFIEIEEELEDETYSDEVDGNVSVEEAKREDADKRIRSGWYGPQEPGRLRMDPDLALLALQEKSHCAEGALGRHGLYQLTYIPTGDSYIGKAERQSLEKRLTQHFNKAMSNRRLTGNVDSLLRKDPQANNWHLKVLPMEQSQVAAAEGIYIRELKPSLNIQQPHAGLYD